MTAVAEVREQAAIVRFFAAPAPMRAAFRLLEESAPRLGAWWAERIWFTLPQANHRYAMSGVGSVGARFTLDLNGHSVAGAAWGDGPTVYLMHGWAGYSGQMSAFVPPLVARGYRVVTFDAPSHGESGPGRFGPRSSSLPEFADTLAAVVRANGPAHAIIAHSMGAAAAAVVLCDGTRSGRLAMLAPMSSPMSYGRQFATALGFGEQIHRRLMARIERRIGAPMHHFDVPELGRAVAMPPTLIVHDRGDSFMPVSNGTAIAAAWSGSRLHLTSGLGHRRLLRDPDVVAQVVDFVSA